MTRRRSMRSLGKALWCGLLAAGIVFALVGFESRTKAEHSDFDAQDCAAWDLDASANIAALISNVSAVAEIRLDEAMLQLRRARRYCRAGRTEVARNDYASLQRALSSWAMSVSPTALPSGKEPTP